MTNQQTELDQAIPVRTRSPHALTLGPRGLTRELRLGHKGNATRLQVIPRMQSIVAVGAQVACALGADRTIAFILADFVLDELRAAAPPEFVVHVLCFL
jgi:hypothetical protein